MLEHVDDVDRVIAETARVLKPGGIYLYDTINRTSVSKLVMIKLFQDWQWSSFMPPRLRVWSMFIKPAELRAARVRQGLENLDLTGMKPAANPIQLLFLLRRLKHGSIELPEFAGHAIFRETHDTSVSYMGYAVKLH